MDRRLIRRLPVAAGILLATALMLTCSNPFNLLGTLETEVKIANDKFLVVKDFAPDNSATNVNPGASVSVQFDRAVDMTTVSESTVTVVPMLGIDLLEFSFNSSTNTLSIDAYPLYADSTDYAITVTKGVRGTDGSEVQNELAWAYETGTYPNGNLKIKVGAVLDAPYINIANAAETVYLHITTNTKATQYRVSTSDPNLLASNEGWVIKTTADFDILFTLDSAQGVLYAWAQFTDGTDVSIARFDTIIRDTIAPAPPTWNLVSTTPSPTLDNTPIWYWTPSEPSPALYGRVLDGGTEAATTLSYLTFKEEKPLADGLHNLQVRQRDAAGNWSIYNAPYEILVTPCFPLDGATGESTKGYLQWRSQRYDLGYTLHLKGPKNLDYVSYKLEIPEFKVELLSGAPYLWYVEVANKYIGDYVLPPQGAEAPFSFTTK